MPEEGPLTLVVGGAGVHKLERIVGCLIDAGLPGHIAVVAVNNSGTQGRLAQKARHRSLSVVGHVSNMSDWMWASDVMITKAGPNTIYEAMRCRLPMILTDAIPGQETGNISFVEAHGMGIYATRPAEIAAAAQRILSDDATAEPMKQAMDRMCRADAAQQIAKMLIG